MRGGLADRFSTFTGRLKIAGDVALLLISCSLIPNYFCKINSTCSHQHGKTLVNRLGDLNNRHISLTVP